MGVRLNIDVGELRDEPAELYASAHLVNVACGGHAGDAGSMARAAWLARAWGAEVGAHPGYPDRAGFGRVSLPMSAEAVRAAVRAQCGALAAVVGPVHHMKAHGALYHDADRDPSLAAAVVDGAVDALGPVYVLGPAHGHLAAAAAARGLPFLVEGFADRGVGPDDRLIPRGQPGALLTDPGLAAARAATLLREGRVGTIGVHGDTPGAVAIARAVRAVLG